jgi:putative ABC transport system permease protein
LGGVAAISLIVGGIGIMNIMLVSVTERTREIGIRKAMGAKRRQILMQFLLEGLAITAMGGAAGILLSYLLVTAIGILPFIGELIGDTSRSTDIHLWLSPAILCVATGVLGLTGVLSGLLPAIRAARMDPIEALRRIL